MVVRGLAGTLCVWAVGALLLRLSLAPAHVCPDVTPTDLRASAAASVAWIERALQPDGAFVYEYDASTGAISGDYNEVRHAGVTMSLYQYMAATGDLGSLQTADRAMQWSLDASFEHDGWIAIQNPRNGVIKLGASSLALAGLVLRREATGDERYDDVMRQYARFIVAMQRTDGSFLNYWLAGAGYPDPSVTSKYATGEAFWALALLHNMFPGEGWDQPARAVADYLALYRDEAEQFDFPPWADQWAAYGLAEMAAWPLEEHHITYAESLAERFGFLVRVESQRGDTWLLKEIHGPRTRAAGHGTWVEGLTSLYRLAAADERFAHLRADIGDRAICGAGMLVDRQVGAADATRYEDPGLAEGAWFTDNITRMDDQQHALSGLILTVAILEERE